MAKNRGASPPPAPEGNQRAAKNGGGASEGNKNAVGNSGGGAPVNNLNAMQHGVHAAPDNIAQDFSSAEKAFVNAFERRYLEVAPFDRDDPRAEQLAMAAVKEVQAWRGEQEIAKDGPSVEKVVGTDADGNPVIDRDEHPLARFTSRLSRDVRMILKDLGCLPDPDSEQAEATRSLADVLSDTTGDEPDTDT